MEYAETLQQENTILEIRVSIFADDFVARLVSIDERKGVVLEPDLFLLRVKYTGSIILVY